MKKLLVVWPVHRKDWVQVFSSLSKDFELTFLASIFEGPSNYVNQFAKTVHWSEFESAEEVLDKTAPNKIVFMSIDSGLSMVLNYAAKKRKIKTYILQHGIYTNYRDYRNREKLWRKKEKISTVQSEKDQGQFSSFTFAMRSLKGLDRLIVLSIFLYQIASKYRGPYWSAKHLPLRFKRATHYLCFSPYNSIIHKETDRIMDDQITYVGSAELEAYLVREEELLTERFYLHMDQALAENSFGEETVSRDKMISFYTKLNDFSQKQGAKLYIKLHPETYNSNWLPKHENIHYLRDVSNLNIYVQSAIGCFGFYSTMIIPAVYWKPTVLFRIQYSGLQEKLEEISKIKVLPFDDFHLEPSDFVHIEDPDKVREVFINSARDSSSERIREALLDDR